MITLVSGFIPHSLNIFCEVERPIPNIYVNDIHISPYSCDTALEQIYTLTDNQYFVIGDNFNASIDSRMYGPIRLNDIIGKVIYFWYRRK